MQIPKLAKDILKYLPVLAVMAATVIGLLIGESIYPTSPNSQHTVPGQVFTEPNVQLLPGREEADTCFGPATYMSFPPKCKTADGKFILPPGSWNFFVIPERK